MKLAVILALCTLGIGLGGCKVGVTEADSARLREEFSQENYEKAMKAAGKTEELAAQQRAAQERGEG